MSSRLTAIIFDFDGVICESVDVKKEAFRKLFSNHPEHLTEILDYHMTNGGMSRFRKFEYIYKNILHQPLSDQESEDLGRRFSEYGCQGVIEAPLVNGAEEFLKTYAGRLQFFVASGTPQEEMDEVVGAKGLGKYFQAIYGSPALKHDIIQTIVNKFGVKREETVFVGDSVNDLDGAQRAGVEFIGRIHPNYPNPFEQHIPVVKDIAELEQLLKKNGRI